MNKIKFAIFDVGNVCYPYTLDFLNEYCMKMSKSPNSLKEKGGVKKFDYKPFMKGDVDWEQFCQDMCKYCDIDYSKKVAIEFNKQMHKGVGEFYPETLETMDFLRQQGVKVCLLSNALPNLEGTGGVLVDEDKRFTSFNLKRLKPDVEIYKDVLKQLGANPQEVIFVDDKKANVDAANSIGIKGIVYRQENILADVKNMIHKENNVQLNARQR